MKTTTPLFGWRSLRQFFPALLLLLLPLLVRGQSPNIVISQVYGGGGSAATSPTPAFKQDYVELFNRSTTAQAIGGYTLQYASAAGTSFDVSTAFPAGTIIPAGSYFLVALSTTANSNGSVLPTPDFTPAATLTLAATAGKVALVNGSTPLPAPSSAIGPTIIDFVGYGTAANIFEGSNPTSNLSTILAAFRGNGGCMDTNQNSADFTTMAPSPRNASNTRPSCTDPVLVANSASLSLSATTGQVAPVAAYTLAGYNLAANTSVSISSSNAAVLVSATGAAGSFASTASVTTSASGELSQTISVQFTAPAMAGTTLATISNSGIGKNGSGLAASVTVTGASIMAYTWNGTSTSYSAAGSWSPARTTLTTSDILLFDGMVTPTATVTLDYNPTQNVPAQTIGQLQFINNVAATLSTDMSRTLTLDNNMPGDDFVIRAGSSVTITNNSTAGTSGLDILLTSTETGAVGGTLLFAGLTGTTNGRHTLQATAAGAIQFVAGSLFQVASTYTTANPFGGGSTNAGSVFFRNGARFEQYGGGNPFALSAPASVVVFEPASTFLFGMSGSAPSLAGRTYGNFLYDVSGSSTASSTTGALTIQGDLTVRNGTVSIGGTGSIAVQGNVQVANAASFTLGSTGGMALQGNVLVNDAATLAFAPVTAAAVQLSGTANQTVGGTSTASTAISFNAATTLVINNAAGVTLGMPITILGTLQLTSGLLTTTTASSLTLAANAMGGSNTSFVNGPVIRPVSAAGTYTFPIGKRVSYRPLTLTVNTQTGTAYYRAEQVEGNPGQNVGSSGLTRVSLFRSFTITPFASAADAATGTVTQPINFTGTATLSFGSNDDVTDPSQLVVAKRPNSASAWANQGYTASTGTGANGTVTSGTFNSFSNFALGSTDPITTNNPLPVTLTSFGATRQASGAVQVRWATALEQHSAYFEVQRSLDGSTFTLVDKVAAQGTASQAHPYASLDAVAPASQLYYRLRQVDTDGTSTFSPVVTLAAIEAATSLTLYPNPAHGYLTVNLVAGEEAQILDLTGRTLQKTILPASGQLSVEALPTGTYLLRVLVGGQPHMLRFTKE